MKRLSFNLVDKVVLFYNLTITIHVLLSYRKLPNWPILLTIHAGIFFTMWLFARWDQGNQRRLAHWVHVWYPIALLLWFYPETGLLRHTIIPRDLDPELLSWEITLFPQRFYATVPLMLSVLTLELLHAVYFSYYLLLWLPALVAFAKNRKGVHQYLFVLTASLFAHYWFTIVFPASGPVHLRQDVMPQGFLFIPIMNFLYATVDQGGAAFPSTHAVAAIIATWYGSQFFPRLKVVLYFALLMILISTVVCCYHYTIDIVAGVITGSVCLLFGRRLYGRLGD